MLQHVNITGIGELAHCVQTLMCERGVVGVGFGSGCGENRRSHWPSSSGLVLVLRIALSFYIFLPLSKTMDLSANSPQGLRESSYQSITATNFGDYASRRFVFCSILVKLSHRTSLDQASYLDSINNEAQLHRQICGSLLQQLYRFGSYQH
jgi:hypothetical protein